MQFANHSDNHATSFSPQKNCTKKFKNDNVLINSLFQANLGKMDDREDCISIIISNLALVQCQGIVVGFVASVVAIVMDLLSNGIFDFDESLLLCASAIVTASIASFALGLVMVGVILISRKCRINPDNVATPIAGIITNSVK